MTKKNVLFIAILTALFCILNAYNYNSQIAELKKEYIEDKKHENEELAKNLSTQFNFIHQLIKSIASYPSIKNIDRHATNFTEENRNSLRQLYRYAYLNIQLSELYIVPKDLDADKIDPVTKKNEEPILMFDDFIAGAEEAHHEGEQEKEGMKLEEVETEEYALLKNQMNYFSQHFSTRQANSNDPLPIMSGKEVITCDNSEFTPDDFKKGNDAPRKGIVISTPVYDQNGQFHAAVSAIIRTSVLAKLLPKGQFILSLEGGATISNHPTQLTLDYFNGKLKSSNLPLYAESIQVPIADSAGKWKLYSTSPDSEFYDSPRVKNYRNMAIFIYIAIIAAGLILLLIMTNSDKRKKKINELVERINTLTNELKNSSTSLAQISNSLSTEATEQSSAIQQTAASLHEITSMANVNFDKSKNIVESTEEGLSKAQKAENTIEQLQKTMDDIAKGVNDLIAKIDQSNNDTTKILDIINSIEQKTKIINEIVFQTKLLSFNASVEAARAGESGKGFAVVAEEIGNLATMSGQAALEISDLIKTSVESVSNIVSTSKQMLDQISNENLERTQTGKDVVSEIGDLFSAITKNIAEASELSQQISNASKEQSHGVSEINQAIGQIDATTASMANNASITANSAETLETQIKELMDLGADLKKVV